MEVREFKKEDLKKVKKFTDQWIGENYYDLQELEGIFEKSQKGEHNTSYVALDKGEVVAVRLTFAPGKWIKEARGLSIDRWECAPESVGYFKSLFVAEGYQGKGLGKKMSSLSLEQLEVMGAKAVVCHSWLESPGNSSQKYLMKMGFLEVNRFEKFWYPIDYECTRCSPSRCICTAAEMIKYL